MGNQEAKMKEMDHKREKEKAFEKMLYEELSEHRKRKEKVLDWVQEMERNSERREEERLSRVSSILEEYNKRMKSLDEELNSLKGSAEIYEGDLKEAEVEHNTVVESIEAFNQILRQKEKEMALAREKFEESYDQAQEVTKKTGVKSGNIEEFLKLVLEIIPTVIQGEQQSVKMQEKFKAFSEIIKNSFTDDIKIKDYFNKLRLSNFVSILVENGLETMEDLVCENEEEYEGDILSLLKQQKMNVGEKRRLKRLCLKPDTWRNEKLKKEKLNKDLLSNSGPVMAEFFERIYMVTDTASRLLEIGSGLNFEQQRVLQDGTANFILAPRDSEECEFKDDSIDNIGSTGVMLRMEKTLLWDTQFQDISEKNNQLSAIALHSISVVDSMRIKFENAEQAKTFAINIEATCTEMMHAQSSLRNKVGLIMKISAFKPVNPSGKAKKLWEMIKKSSLQIFQSAIETSKTSYRYFAFFLRFKQSFLRYMKAVEDPDCSSYIASESLLRDLHDFMDFEKEYEKNAQNLKEKAMECLDGCLSDLVSSKGIMQQLKESQERYLEALRNFQEEKEKAPELEEKKKEAAVKVKKNRRLSEMTDENIKWIGKQRSLLLQKIEELEKILTK